VEITFVVAFAVNSVLTYRFLLPVKVTKKELLNDIKQL
jgi:hypothetical protein